MAGRSLVFTKAQVAISTSTNFALFGSNRDVTHSVKNVELSRVFDMLDDTVMGETARSRKAGLEDATATIEFVQTFDEAGKQRNIDKILSDVADTSQSGKSVRVSIKPTTAFTSTNNPLYEFQAVLESHTPMSGGVGEVLMTSVPFKSAGGSLSRITTPRKPGVPRSASATAIPGTPVGIRISWTAPADTGGSVIQYYVIRRSDTADGTYEDVGTSTTLQYDDTTVASGTRRHYKVFAYNYDGGGPSTTQVNAASG